MTQNTRNGWNGGSSPYKFPKDDGKINPSIYMMRKELIERKRKKERYSKMGSIGIMIGLLPFVGLFFIEGFDFQGLFNYFTSPLIIFGILLLFFSYAFNQIYYQKAKDKYDSLKEELISKIWNDFCNCWNACSHKEDFLQETNDKYGINLYWK